MRSSRFYLPQLKGGGLQLEGDSMRHALHSLRLRQGSDVTVFDGQGSEAPARIASVGKRSLELTLTGEPLLIDRRPSRDLGVALAFPKARSRDLIVEKLVELGVRRIRPLLTARSAGAPSLDRLRAQALAACQQSGINTLPEILPPLHVGNLAGDVTLVVLDPAGTEAAPEGDGLTLVVGPEGGFDPGELAHLGGRRWSLGPRILRVETACLAAVSRLLI